MQRRSNNCFINLVHNAVDASLENWRKRGDRFGGKASDCWKFLVRDGGRGFLNPTNIFVPFFTDKA